MEGQIYILTKRELSIIPYMGFFFIPLNFHELHELFWIREIKFVKYCRNIIVILVTILKFLVKMHGFVKI